MAHIIPSESQTLLPDSTAKASNRCPARLVFLLQDLRFGGTQRQTLELVRLLDPRRFQAEVWLLCAGDDLAPLARQHGIPLVWLSRSPTVGPGSLAHLWRRLRSGPPDLLLPLTVVPNIWGRVLGRLARVPRIAGNCRGGGAPERQHERRLWRLAHHLFSNSQVLKTRLVNRYGIPEHRITVIPNGVDTDFFRPPAVPPAAPAVVLAVGRMVPEKDHDTLVQAFGLLAEDHPQAELWLVGEGPRRAAVQDLARRCLAPGRVRFLPGQADLRPLLHRASLLVLSSVAEAFPNVVLEAMAAGLPVVATRVGGVPEMVIPGATGWLVEPGNPPALAAAMSQVLGDAATRQAFGRAGRARAVREFSLETMVRRYEDEFQRLLAI